MGVAEPTGALRRPSTLRHLALASVVANVVIVVTGGLVRLTSSGLGCPTWPTCTDGSLVPNQATAWHGIVEFSNRTLTFVLTAIAVATLVVAIKQRRERSLAWVAFLGIPAQAVLGGITVLTELNPWAVGGHFLLTAAIIAVTFVLWWRLARPLAPAPAPSAGAGRAARTLAWLTVFATAVVLALGTVVTGAGPHAGDLKENGKLHRNGFSAAAMSQLHADAVILLVGLVIGLTVLVTSLRFVLSVQRAVWLLLVVLLGQGVVGVVQYVTHLPAALVVVHMLGSSLAWLAALQVLFILAPPVPGRQQSPSEHLTQGVDDQTNQGANNGAVDADELQIPSHL